MRRFTVAALLALAGGIASAGELLVVGNSIAFHAPKPEVGWPHSNGMAASSPERDYAHQVAATLKLNLTALNLAALERGEPHSTPNMTPDLLVVQLGDNVLPRDTPAFAVRYAKLLRAIRAKRLICIGTWWRDFAKDAAIYDACTAAGGEYLYIGDIFRDPANPDTRSVRYADKGVNEHPHDWGMARIAERVAKAAR